MIHTGLIGEGLMAQVYARRCAAIPGVELTAVRGNSPHDASPTVYNDVQELCKADLDLVLVCSPPRRSVVKTAADEGIDLFCPPPIASTVEEATAIAGIVRDAGIVFVPGHVSRFSPAYATAKERLEEIGTVGNARTFRQLPTDQWVVSRDRETDVVCGLALHDIDFLRWSCGAVERVFARRTIHNGDAYALITLRFATAVGHIDARLSDRSGLSFVRRFELAGEDGLIEFDSEDSSPVTTRAAGDSPETPFDTMLPKDPHRLLLEHVIDCVESDAEPVVSIEESIESLRVGLAALASIEQGGPVTINDQ